MAHPIGRPRGSPPPEELRQRLVALLATLGPGRLSAQLGLSRHAVLGAAAGCPVLPGTAALLRERLPLLERGES